MLKVVQSGGRYRWWPLPVVAVTGGVLITSHYSLLNFLADVR
jgi:hypothetical protein